MTIYEFFLRLSLSIKIMIMIFIASISIVALYFYKYVGDLKDLSWYITLSMMIGIVIIYLVLFATHLWLLSLVLDWTFDGMAHILIVLGVAAIIEAMIFAGVAYLFIDTAKVFWLWFFGLQVYRIIFLSISFLIKRYYESNALKNKSPTKKIE